MSLDTVTARIAERDSVETLSVVTCAVTAQEFPGAPPEISIAIP